MTLRGDRIAALTAFVGPAHVTRAGLPPAV
jgi:hypothetical protein